MESTSKILAFEQHYRPFLSVVSNNQIIHRALAAQPYQLNFKVVQEGKAKTIKVKALQHLLNKNLALHLNMKAKNCTNLQLLIK